MAAEHLQHAASDSVSRQVSRILSSTDRVERMVDLLLDLTQIRLAGGMPVERRPVDLGALCHRAIEELRTP
jgi:signal transduction histidine kinase